MKHISSYIKLSLEQIPKDEESIIEMVRNEGSRELGFMLVSKSIPKPISNKLKAEISRYTDLLTKYNIDI